MERLEILQNKLERQKKGLRLLEGMLEDKTRELYLANRSLEEERNRLLAIFDNMADPVVVLSRDRRILFTNRSFKQKFGEANDRPCYEVLHGHTKPCNDCSNCEVLQRNEALRCEESLALDDLTFEVIKSPFRYRSEETSILMILRDITERKRMEEELRKSEKRFRDIVENALEWIWEVDSNGKYTYASPVVENILGYKPEEVLGKYFYDLFHPDDREELKKAAFEVFAKKQTLRELINRNLHKSGKTVWLSTSGVPILDKGGKLLGYRGADTDVTERTRAEQALRQAEAERRRITEALREAEKLAVVGEMAGRVAHEVLNPVTALLSRTQAEIDYLEVTDKAVRAMGEILQDWQKNLKQGRLSQYLLQTDQGEGECTFAEQDLAVLSQGLRRNKQNFERTQELLSFFEQQLGRVIRIVDNLRQMSRSKREVGEVDLNHCLRQVAELFQDGLSKRGIKLNRELEPQVPRILTDYTELFQVVSNLLRNAMLAIAAKRQEGGEVTMSSQVVGEEVWVRVVDDGLGIPEDRWASVFEHGFSAGSGDGETGLDLAISRRLVREMGGELLLESSQPEGGSSFLVKLPLTKASGVAEIDTERAAPVRPGGEELGEAQC